MQASMNPRRRSRQKACAECIRRKQKVQFSIVSSPKQAHGLAAPRVGLTRRSVSPAKPERRACSAPGASRQRNASFLGQPARVHRGVTPKPRLAGAKVERYSAPEDRSRQAIPPPALMVPKMWTH